MTRRKVKTNCSYCNKEFESILRWEGIPNDLYCSKDCELDDADYEDDENFEKLPKGGYTEWH